MLMLPNMEPKLQTFHWEDRGIERGREIEIG